MMNNSDDDECDDHDRDDDDCNDDDNDDDGCDYDDSANDDCDDDDKYCNFLRICLDGMEFWTHPWWPSPGENFQFKKRIWMLQYVGNLESPFSSLYIGMGFFGYLKYGADIASTITLNMDLVRP